MDPLHKRMLARLPKARESRWYEMKNLAGPIATVRIYDEIGYWGVTAEDFASELSQVTAPEIEVQINSPGGEVFAGIAIYNALRSHPAKVTTRVDGIAASIASVIAQAGDHRVMLSSAQMMIHEAWGLAVGPARDMREMADLLDRQSDVIAGIYASRSGGDVAAFREHMAAEKWLTDKEAVELGLADEVVEPERKETTNVLVTELRLSDDQVTELAAKFAAALIPPVPPEDTTPPSGERVDPELATRLLDAITFPKENNQ